MANEDTTALADLALRVGLLTAQQVQEGFEEVGQRGADPDPFLRAMERKAYLTTWQTQKLVKGERDGYFLGGYRILYKIASGTFGRVYRAEDPRSGRIVAVKVLRRKWKDDKHNIELFEREGRLGMSLQHPGIVEILAVNRDQASKQFYIVMEFVEGGNLRDFLNIRKKLDSTEAMRVLEEVASALTYAFSKGVTHRDMKLTNILVSSTQAYKLVDFGLAGANEHSVDQKDQVDRTVDYAGLEKATQVPPGDTRSDIFFLGCVIYELLTGRSPIKMSKDAKARMSAERFANIPPIKPEEVGGHFAVIRLMETMMSLKPSERFQTPTQVLDAVQKVRRQLDNKNGDKTTTGPRSIFLAEKDEHLQDILRTHLKEKGFRVLIAADPARAVDRFRQQPFDILVINAGTTGPDGVDAFERIMNDAERFQIQCPGVLILGEEQASMARKVKSRPGQTILVQPVKFKQLLKAIGIGD